MTSLLPAPPRPAPRRAPLTRPAPAQPARPVEHLGPAPRGRAALATAAVAGAGLLALLVLAVTVGGGAPAPATSGLPDAGPVVGWGGPVVELLGRLAAVLAIGSLLLAAALVPAGAGGLPPVSRRAVRTAAAAGAVWAACEAAGLVLLTGELLGRPVTRLAAADVLAVAAALPAGRTVPVVLLLLAVLVAGARARTRARARVLLVVALAAAALPVVTTGHPASAGDHVTAVVTLVLHVVTASLWVGGLVAVLLHLGPGVAGAAGPARDQATQTLATQTLPAQRVAAVQRLSRLALVCVLVVTVTGVLGALLVAGQPVPVLLTSGYGALLAAKTAAVALLVAAGWAHRRTTLPQLAVGRPGAFLRLGLVEAGLMGATLAVAVALASAPPPEAAPTPLAATVAGGTPDGARSPGDAPAGSLTGPAPGSAAPDEGAGGTAGAAAGAGEGAAPADDMAGHDHGELSVAVLVDGERFHVGDPVAAGAPVTVYNSGPDPVVLEAEDGSFRATVPSRTFLTFPAPSLPGEHPFGDPTQPRYRDVLTVLPAP